MLPIEQRLHTLFTEKFVAIIRVPEAERAMKMAHALARGGFKCIEVTMTVPGAVEAIKALASNAPEGIMIGAGTVTSAADARQCIDAGAQFIVSPMCETDIIRPCREAGVVSIPAGLSPTEIMRAWRIGAHVIKVFPAGSVGGPAYIKALRGPMPDIPLWVSGMLDAHEARNYLCAGVQIVGLNANALPQDRIELGDWDAVADGARAMLEQARG
jgi:2-dehydro-3-deoxyphosphogluconate aldolase/(4S)-4-hydroxy-2-oxoglutarate aldolase